MLYEVITDYDSSIAFAEEALSMAEKKYPKLEAEAYTCLGSANDFHGKYDLAIANYQKSYDKYQSINDVITSYSIHYTKLYEYFLFCKFF